MKIKRVVIKNYRSIKELEFEPGDLCTLIGENNSGKSTIVRALNLVLGEVWPYERNFDEGDFWNPAGTACHSASQHMTQRTPTKTLSCSLTKWA